jgi:hypothetical protein
MDYWFILYILIAVGVCLGGMVVLIQSHRTLGGFLFLIGSILIFVFYGLRWFSGDALRPTKFSSTTWPPVINLCPDFLSLYDRGSSSRPDKICVDLIGVSSGNAGIQKFIDPSNATSDKYVFRLFQDKNGSDRLKSLCQECKDKGVTWEGIFDGVSCQDPSFIPRTDGTKDSTKPADKCK